MLGLIIRSVEIGSVDRIWICSNQLSEELNVTRKLGHGLNIFQDHGSGGRYFGYLELDSFT